MYELVQINISNIKYLNCREKDQDKVDHRCYTHDLSSCEIKAFFSGFNFTTA